PLSLHDALPISVMNEPSARKNGATNNQIGPKVASIWWAIYSGILFKSLILMPELIKTCTIANVATSVIPVILMVDNDSLHALSIFLMNFLCTKNAYSADKIRIVPGE